MRVDAPARNRRVERREATRAEILAAAWELVREQGLAALSLRDIASRIGMRPPSLYWYFESKLAIYDAMFAEGNRELLRRMEAQPFPKEPRALLSRIATLFVEFSTEDAARSQLLFQRTIPDFVPSAESYALAIEVLERARAKFVASGVTDPASFDLWTALISGLALQQAANDPGGNRWIGIIDDAVDMYVNHVVMPTSRRSAT
jgi:AcrR family transcriptional regulator